MNVYAVGAYGYRNFGDDCYTAVLRSKLPAVWADADVDFHGSGGAPFSPDRHGAVVFGGGGVLCRYVAACGTDNLAYFLRYAAAMHIFGKSSYALGLGVQGPFATDGLEHSLPIIDRMALRTVRDAESARILRAAGVTSPVLTCADLAYLLLSTPRPAVPGKPVLGIVASQPDKNVVYAESQGFEDRIREAVQDLERDFELRFISFAHHADGWLPSSIIYDPDQPGAVEKFQAEFRQLDLCLTSRFHGIVLSVLNEIPFVAIGARGEKLERECAALEYPFFLPYDAASQDVVETLRQVWAEREALQLRIAGEKPRRIKLAERNIEVLHAAESAATAGRSCGLEPDRETLVIWAAGDEFWDEAQPQLKGLRAFDCLVPASSRLHPAEAKRRFAIPAGRLMHWSMMPAEITGQIEKRYDNVVLCHASGRGSASHLSELAARSGKRIWEFELWANTCNASEKDNSCN